MAARNALLLAAAALANATLTSFTGAAEAATPTLAELPLMTAPAFSATAPRTVAKGGETPIRVFPSANGSVIIVHRDAGGSPQTQQLPPADRQRLSTTPGLSACVGWAQQASTGFRQSLLYMNRDQPVMAVRTEVFEEGKESATLRVADYWVDPKTGGVQPVSAPIELVLRRATALNEPSIYAFRTATSVVLVAGSAQGSNFQGSSGKTMSSQCDAAFAEIEIKDGAGTVQGLLNVLTMIEETRARTPDAPPTTMPFQRQLHVSASISQTSRDPAPLFSISTRWLTDLPPQFKVQKL